MANLDDIRAARDTAVHILDNEIRDALAKQNAAATEAAADAFDDPIHRLMSQRTAVFVQAANEAWQAQEIQDAINQLNQLTSDMSNVAAKMGSVTGFFNNVADLLDAGTKVVDVLKKA
jgi:hypothetical protein